MVRRGATFDTTGAYRYQLWREWEQAQPRACFVMLNPSTADATQDDPTIRRCMSFARRWGYGSIEVVNLFAFRATRPADLFQATEPVGPQNDEAIRGAVDRAALVLAAWGIHGCHLTRHDEVIPWLGEAFCLGCTTSGQPRHPLYVRGDYQPEPFTYSLLNPSREITLCNS